MGPEEGGGRGSRVHGSSVGKYGRRFSGLFAFSSSLLLRNSGHLRLALACEGESQLMQRGGSVEGQLEVQCSPAHDLHVSFSSLQDLARWPQRWHLRHLNGSFLSLMGRSCRLL